MANSSAIADQLPKEDIILNVSSVSDLCSSWSSKVNGLNLTGSRVNNDFKILSSFGILENYITCLATAVNSLTTTVTSICNSVSSAKDSHVEVDGKASSYSDNNTAVKSGNHSGSSSNSNYSNQDTIVDKPIVSPELSVKDNLSLVSMTDLVGIAICIYKMKSDSINSLDDILMSDEYVALLKKELLESVNISDATKELIKSMDIDVLKQELKSISNEGVLEIPMDDSLKIFSKYISAQVKLKNMSLESLLKDPKNSEVLEEMVDDFCKASTVLKEVVSDGSTVSRIKLLEVLKGKNPYNLSPDDDKMINNLITSIADGNNTTPEEYIANYNVRRDADNMMDFCDYAKELSKLDENSIQKITSTFI